MKRIELFEFEDFQWFPTIIRSGVTNLITVLHQLMGTAEVIAKLILNIRGKHGFAQIIDLGSGSGGPMLEVVRLINESDKNMALLLILSDLHPNAEMVTEINDRKLANVSYHNQSIDATNLADAGPGLKTMVASFHHMQPSVAKKILLSAQDSGEPILIFEIAKNNIPIILWVLLLPISLAILILMSLIMTPFVRPLTLKQLLFTYLIPIIPIVYAWDGQASIMRTYTFEDIKSILPENIKGNYKWTIKDAEKANGKNLGYYIMGHPKSENSK